MTKLYLQSIDSNLNREKPVVRNCFTEYMSDTSATLSRDGIFHCLFNKLFDSSEKIPHVLLSRFDLYKNDSLFYRIVNTVDKPEYNKSTLIVLFNLNYLECPIDLLNDFLGWLKKYYLDKYPGMTLLANYNYQVDLSNNVEQIYILNYFQLIQKYLGNIPDSIALIDIEKRASFENVSVVEAGTQWSCMDNYLVHVISSKGGALIQQSSNQSEFEIVGSEVLSPYHSLQLVRKTINHRPDLICSFVSELSEKNFYKNPHELKLFNYLMYQDIFGAGSA
jgi:hypothetical protein